MYDKIIEGVLFFLIGCFIALVGAAIFVWSDWYYGTPHTEARAIVTGVSHTPQSCVKVTVCHGPYWEVYFRTLHGVGAFSSVSPAFSHSVHESEVYKVTYEVGYWTQAVTVTSVWH